MPSLGADMEGGTVVEWLKQPGEAVSRGEVVAVIETDKGAIEIEVFAEGILGDLAASVGDYREVGELLAKVEGEGDAEGVASVSPPGSENAAIAVSEEPYHGRTRISPAARRRAEALGVNLVELKGTGRGGAITLSDVEDRAREGGKAEADDTPASRPKGIDIPRMRKAIAAAMARSKREIPHYYVSATIDVTAMIEWLGVRNAAAPVTARILPVVPLIKAAALAARQAKGLNGIWTDDAFHESDDVNIGVAIALRGGGLAAPAILETETLSIDELMAKLRDLSGRVRRGNMRGSEIAGATFTVSSVGEGNIDSIVPIIYPPQVAILGIGSISRRPWVVDGELCVRQLCTVTLAGDHRASDGRVGARFLDLYERLLQEPGAL